MRGDERGDVGRRCGAREVSREPEWHSTLDFVLYDLRRDLGGNHTGGGTWIVVAYGDRRRRFSILSTYVNAQRRAGGAARADEGRGALYTQTLATVLQSKRKKCNRAVTVP